MPDGRILQIFRDGRHFYGKKLIQLAPGKQGNLRTVGEMAQIVREDSASPDMCRFIRDRILGDAADLDAAINAAYTFARDQIVYRDEGDDTETVADLWSCMYVLGGDLGPTGDCAIKSTALATCLGSLKIRPYFIVIRQLPDEDSFDHVFVGYDDPRTGEMVPLDPTPPEFRRGDRLPSIESLKCFIWKTDGSNG